MEKCKMQIVVRLIMSSSLGLDCTHRLFFLLSKLHIEYHSGSKPSEVCPFFSYQIMQVLSYFSIEYYIPICLTQSGIPKCNVIACIGQTTTVLKIGRFISSLQQMSPLGSPPSFHITVLSLCSHMPRKKKRALSWCFLKMAME